jgi:probable phosphoglycerate mutase
VLILARHGRTAANVAGRLLGHHDPPLDDVGRRQAEALGRVLAAGGGGAGGGAVGRVVRVVTSPLTRTRQTAEAIAVAVGAPMVVDERWIELDYGELDGKTSGEVPSAVWAAWRADPAYVVEGGESLDQLGSRVARACEALAAEAEAGAAGAGAAGAGAGGDVIVVSHVSPIKAAVAWALGVDQRVSWRMFVGVGSITRIDLTARGPVLRSFNETAHLPVTR